MKLLIHPFLLMFFSVVALHSLRSYHCLLIYSELLYLLHHYCMPFPKSSTTYITLPNVQFHRYPAMTVSGFTLFNNFAFCLILLGCFYIIGNDIILHDLLMQHFPGVYLEDPSLILMGIMVTFAQNSFSVASHFYLLTLASHSLC